jgi:glycosyltransferase involved in cell wall biosynthesis
MSERLVTVVIPCYNEADGVESCYRAIAAELAQLDCDHEMIFVDDGSTDDTLVVLRSLAKRDPAVRYLSFSRNFGKEPAMLAGLRHSKGDAVITMDADLQHPPALIPDMIERYEKGYDQVVARRSRTNEDWHRRMSARLYYRMMRRLIDVPLIDGGGDFRLLSRRAVDALVSMPEYNRFSKGLYAWVGFETCVIDYENVTRAEGTSKWSMSELFNYGISGVLSFNDRPLRGAIYIGASVTAIAAVYDVAELIRTIVLGVRAPGYLTLLTAVVVLGGLQLIFLGMVGEYVGKVYFETKRRPHYIVQEDNLPPVRDRR